MAEMLIPDTIPTSSTAGERRVFATLARLPDDCLKWPFGELSERQISILRSVIHPQIVISPKATKAEQSLAVLDLRQERNAHSLGDGHRIVYGVAGSGKTVILIARAHLVAQDPKTQVLTLCFNRALAEYFQRLFAQTTNVTCLTFHQWGSQRNCVRFNEAEDEEAFGERLLQRLQHGEGDAHKYDAVFIDQAQDFAKSWFLCSKLALNEPDDGDLLIVGDGSQSLYRRRTFTWREAALISQQAAVYWPHDTSGSFVDPSGVCVRTMHSAKGLQWRAVLVMRCDMMPLPGRAKCR